jgi:hypothetical protein
VPSNATRHSSLRVGKNGNGFDLVLVNQISVSGRIVCTERKEKTADDNAAA